MDNSSIGTIIEFTGFLSANTGDTFTIRHDDGVTLIIDGVNLGFYTSATGPYTETRTYTGASGSALAFQLVYGECCGGDAVLEGSLPIVTPVPLPAALPLLMTGLAGLGVIGARRRVA